MNNIEYIQSYLYEHIPLSHAMEAKVLSITKNTVKLCAPLAPNINHRETVFGGSASALAILSSWSLVHFRLQNENFHCRVVIQKNIMNYEKPILGTFEAICNLANERQWATFIKILNRKGKSRIILKSTLEYSGKIVGEFEGSFVAITI